MGWKDLPYWLKGGLIGALSNIFLLIVIFIFAKLLGENALVLSFTIIPFVSPFIFGVSMFPIPYNPNIPSIIYNTLYLIFPILIYFLIGAVIGLVYGKIKSQNKR